VALRQGLVSLVKASITGSIIGNLLFVLGLAMLSGGIRFRNQTFNMTAARVSSTSLALAAIGLLVPTIFHRASDHVGGWTRASEQQLSLAIATVLFITYGLSLWFSLVTHKELFRGQVAGSAAQESGPAWKLSKCILVLASATVLVSVMSEFLVASIHTAQQKLGVTERFVGVVIVAIVGNVAEHSTAVWMALKNKMDLSLGIAIGSSMQVALFVTPILLFASYAMGKPMTLEFTLPEIAGVALAVWIVSAVSGDGESNWLEGVQLLSVYVIIAMLFFFLPEDSLAPVGGTPASSPH
jgi:Ca2+:H+ antiporter